MIKTEDLFAFARIPCICIFLTYNREFSILYSSKMVILFRRLSEEEL
jgi:hypothetical protein